MKFLVDANVRYAVGTFLASRGHDVRLLAGTPDHQLPDSEALELAHRQQRIVITNDKDFGLLVFHMHLPHHGVILFRLSDESRANFLQRIDGVLQQYGERLIDHFTVVADDHVRYR